MMTEQWHAGMTLKFGEKFDLKVGTIEDLIDFRSSKESTVEKILTKKLTLNLVNLNSMFGKMLFLKNIIFP